MFQERETDAVDRGCVVGVAPGVAGITSFSCQPQELRRSAVASEADCHEHRHVPVMPAVDRHDGNCPHAEWEWRSRPRRCKASSSLQGAPSSGVFSVSSNLLKLGNGYMKAAKRTPFA